MEVMTLNEVQDHLELHRSNHLPLTPTASQPSEQVSHDPVPTSPSTDDTLSTSATSSPPSSLPLSTPPPISPASLDSQTLPDTQNPMSPSAPSPPSFSPPPETNEALMRRFLDACGNSPTPTRPTSPLNPATPSPAIPPLMANIISTPTTNVPLTRQPSSPASSSPDIPPLMSNIITTPAPNRPSTCQSTPPIVNRPRAMDFFDPPPPVLEDITEQETATTSPPRPQSLPSDIPPISPSEPLLPSPLLEDPTTASFPTAQTTTSLHNFTQRYNIEFAEDLEFPDFEQLTRQFTSEAIELAKTLSSQQRPRPAKRRPDRPSARPPIDRRRPLPGDPTAAKRLIISF